MPRRRRRSGTRLLLVLLVVLLALPTLAWVGASLLVDADAWRPQIIAAVRRTTGRELRIAHLRLVPALTPTLSITDVSLANLPGGSRPEMLRVPRVQVVLSLLPLLAGRVEIARLELEQPEILLERDSRGAPNWLLGEALTMAAPANPDADTPPARPGAPPGSPPGSGPVVRELRVEGGVVRWRDDTGPHFLKLQRLVASAYGVESPVTVTGRATYEGLNLALEAECGPLSRLVARKAIAPWPLKGTLETPGARLAFSGTLMHPLEGTGYVLALEAATVNLPILDRLVGGPLPPLRQVAIAARVVDGGGDVPEVTGMALRIGDSDLDSLLPGLHLTRAEFSAASLQDRLRGEAEATLDGTRVHLTTALGPLAALLPLDGRPPTLAVEVAAEAGGATLAVNGTVPVPWRRDGIDLAITGRIPDGATLSSVPGSPPADTLVAALRPALLDGRLIGRADPPGLLIRGLAVTTPEADLSGELAVAVSPRLVVQGSLASHRFDLDALRAALQAQAAPPPPPAAGPAARLFPATPLPWPLLSAADLDLRLAVGELRLGGASWRDLAGRVVLQSGRLTLDPLTAAMPGGRAVGHLALDATATPPQVALSAHVPGLGLRALLPLLGVPGDAAGTGDLDFDFHAAGRSPRALAAALSGRLGLAVTDADLDNRLLSQMLPALMPQALPQAAADVQALARPGRTRLRCLALRADVDAGLATVPAVGLEAGRFTLQGAGTLNLREETVQIHLRPALRGNVAMLMRLAGPLAAPRLTPELRGAILPNFPGGDRGDVCAPSLAAVRAGLRAAPPARPSGGGR